MDPFSGIGLASSIITFIDFGCGLVSDAHEIYHSANGLTRDFEDVDLACERSKQIAQSIQSRVVTRRDYMTADDAMTDNEVLQGLAKSCLGTANEITEVLGKMRSKTDGKQTRKLKSLRKAFVQYRGKDKVEQLNQRLQTHRRDLSHHLIIMMR
jgi:ribosomal protein L29